MCAVQHYSFAKRCLFRIPRVLTAGECEKGVKGGGVDTTKSITMHNASDTIVAATVMLLQRIQMGNDATKPTQTLLNRDASLYTFVSV